MFDKRELKYRRNVKDNFLLPLLYQKGYKIDEIREEKRLLVKKGKRKIFAKVDLLVEIKDHPAIVIAVRHGGEEITEYSKEYLIAYARLLEDVAPIVMVTNGIDKLVYDHLNRKELDSLPTKVELLSKLPVEVEISQQLKDDALAKIFKQISLWDLPKRYSAYHYDELRAFDENIKEPFNQLIYHGFNYEPNIPEQDKVEVRVSTKRDLVDRVFLYYTTDGSLPQGKAGIVKKGQRLELTRDYSEAAPDHKHLIDWWSVEIPAQSDKRVRYIIEGYNTKTEISYYADSGDQMAEINVFAYLTNDYQTPNWAKNAVIYQILIDRFCDGDPSNNYDLGFANTDFQGGDLKGILDKLPYIKDLGVDALWLSPVFKGLGYHGYHITDFLEVDHRFGDQEILKQVVDKAHQLGLKIIIDCVPNHTSINHPFFQSALADKDSPYYDWYQFNNWPKEYESFCGLADLPKLNTDYRPTRDYLINDLVLGLIRDYEIDGLRMDHAFGPSHDFWVELRARVKAEAPEVHIFGEIWEGPGMIKKYAGEFDGCLDFSLVWSFRELFIYRSKTVSEFVADLNYLDYVYPKEFIIGRFLDNHDMSRFLWEADDNTAILKLAAICQFTLNGMQIIYYGTEVGLSQKRACFDDNTGNIIFDNSRDFMLWGAEQDRDLYYFYRKLCNLRQKYSALSQGQREIIKLDDQREVLIYKKYDQNDELIIILNIANSFNKIDLKVEESKLLKQDQLLDLIANRKYRIINQKLQLKLKPLQGIILTEL